MTWLFDTNVCVAYLNGRESALRRRFHALSEGEAALCSVVKAELLYGARNSARVDANLQKLDSFFALFTSFPFDDDAAARYGLLRTELRRAGTPIGPNDLMIAAIALAQGLTLVTRNGDEFRRVSGLRVESW